METRRGEPGSFSRDSLLGSVSEFYPNVLLNLNEDAKSERRYADAVDQGVRGAKGEVVLMMDDSVELTDGVIHV